MNELMNTCTVQELPCTVCLLEVLPKNVFLDGHRTWYDKCMGTQNPRVFFLDGHRRGRKTQYASMHCIPESFCTSGKFLRVYTKLTLKSSLSGKFPDSLDFFPHSTVQASFYGQFVFTRKNFPNAQKLSSGQCRHADEVFGTLLKRPVSEYANSH